MQKVMYLAALLLCSVTSAFRGGGPSFRLSTTRHQCTTGSFKVGATFTSPQTIEEMMRNVAVAIAAARDADVPYGLVDIPLPVTGGTELDDWPGGIKQKYLTLYPMIMETMKSLNFTSEAMKKREYLILPGGEGGEDDAVGVWSHDGIYLCSFPTPEVQPDSLTA